MIFSIPPLISETADLAWYLDAFENLLSRKAAGKHVSRYDNKPVAEWLQITRNLDLPSVQRNFEGIIGYLYIFLLFLRRQFWKIYAFFHLSVLCVLLLHCLFLISNNFSFTLTLLLDPETVDQVHYCFFVLKCLFNSGGGAHLGPFISASWWERFPHNSFSASNKVSWTLTSHSTYNMQN